MSGNVCDRWARGSLCCVVMASAACLPLSDLSDGWPLPDSALPDTALPDTAMPTRNLSGVVDGFFSGEPTAGIRVRGEVDETITDTNGAFTLTVPDDKPWALVLVEGPSAVAAEWSGAVHCTEAPLRLSLWDAGEGRLVRVRVEGLTAAPGSSTLRAAFARDSVAAQFHFARSYGVPVELDDPTALAWDIEVPWSFDRFAATAIGSSDLLGYIGGGEPEAEPWVLDATRVGTRTLTATADPLTEDISTTFEASFGEWGPGPGVRVQPAEDEPGLQLTVPTYAGQLPRLYARHTRSAESYETVIHQFVPNDDGEVHLSAPVLPAPLELAPSAAPSGLPDPFVFELPANDDGDVWVGLRVATDPTDPTLPNHTGVAVPNACLPLSLDLPRRLFDVPPGVTDLAVMERVERTQPDTYIRARRLRVELNP